MAIQILKRFKRTAFKPKFAGWVFRMVLSYSRKVYIEAVIRKDAETFLRCLENGLRSFGGSPIVSNLDNMKAAVLQADWFDPAINPKLRAYPTIP